MFFYGLAYLRVSGNQEWPPQHPTWWEGRRDFGVSARILSSRAAPTNTHTQPYTHTHTHIFIFSGPCLLHLYLKWCWGWGGRRCCSGAVITATVWMKVAWILTLSLISQRRTSPSAVILQRNPAEREKGKGGKWKGKGKGKGKGRKERKGGQKCFRSLQPLRLFSK